MDICAFVSTLSNNSTQLPSAVLVPFSIPLTQSCVLLFTTMLAELFSPVWLVLLLAILFCLGPGQLCPFYYCHTPVTWLWITPEAVVRIWPSPVCSFVTPVPSLLDSFSSLCVHFTFHTSSIVTLLCQKPWFDSVLSLDMRSLLLLPSFYPASPPPNYH